MFRIMIVILISYSDWAACLFICLFLKGARDFSILRSIHTESWVHPVFYLVDTTGCVSRVEMAGT
jgi:hypothetical protein